MKCVGKSLFSSLPSRIKIPVFLDERRLIGGAAGVHCKDSPAEVIPALPEIPLMYWRHEFRVTGRAPDAWKRIMHIQAEDPLHQQALAYMVRKWN